MGIYIAAEYCRGGVGAPWLNGFSAHILPKPADWDADQHVTGYWFLDAQPGWQPPEELMRFLNSGPPPVCIGLRALELSGQRGLLLTGWGGMSQRPASPNVFFVDNVPHAWLFPRMAAVVTHGGAGTTGADLRAGVPNIITPVAPNDQAAWAERVVTLGVGPRLPGIKQLTAEKLAEAIQIAVTGSALRVRAAALGEKIRAEDGLARAVEIIERHSENLRDK
jgi:UDP:flavonoid glycosyltransferase YjiC (YdhE family)